MPPLTSLPSGVVTFVLSDVVGSTRLWELDSDRMSEGLARHERIIEHAVREHDGVLLKPRGEGDSTFSVFGRPVDGVLAARAIQDAIGDESWRTPEPIAVRIAVHTGAAIERDGDYFGRVVNRAARLRGIANAGQVLLSRSTAELVTDQLPEGLEVRALGAQRLRDLSRPEEVFVVAPAGSVEAVPLGAPAVVAQVPFPSHLSLDRGLPLVGRERELDLLERRTKAAVAGARRVVLLRGEAGIGKTSLAAAAARHAHSLGATVLFGACDEDLVAPYKPFAEGVDHLVVHLPAPLVDEHTTTLHSALARLVPTLRVNGRNDASTSGDDAETERFMLFRSVDALLAGVAAERPIVFVVDDLQWADRGTALLFKHLAVTCTPFPMLLIGTVREGEVHSSTAVGALMSELRRYADVDQIVLRGLTAADLCELLAAATGHAIGEVGRDIADAVQGESAGNPFFATELLRHLGESGMALEEAGRWSLQGSISDIGLPDSIREVIEQRVGRLGNDVSRVLELAAVIGREFDLDVLAGASGRSEDDLLDALDLAVAAGVIGEVMGTAERYAFSHSLVQQTLYAAHGAGRRIRLHGRITEALEAVSVERPADRLDELARHASAARRRGDPASDARAVRYCRLAGELALDRLAPQVAVGRFQEAWEILQEAQREDPKETIDVLIGLGEAQRQSGRPEYRRTLLDAAHRARAIGDVERLVRAALANNRGTYSQTGAVDSERVEVIEAALTAIGDAPHPAVPMLLAMSVTEQLSATDLSYRVEVTDRAVALARRHGDDETLARVLALRFEPIWVPANHVDLQRDTSELLELSRAAASRSLEFFAARLRNLICWEAGDTAEADAQLARQLALADALGQPYMRWVARLASAGRHVVAGRLEAGEEEAGAALALSTESGEPEALMAYGGQLVELRRAQGRSGELIGAMTAFEGLEGVDIRPSVASLHVELGDLSAARATLGDLLDAPFSAPQTRLEAESLCHLGAVVAALDHEEAAARLYPLIAPWERLLLVNQVNYYGPIAHLLGGLATTLARFDVADRCFSWAEDVSAAVPLPYWLQETRLARARLLFRRGRPSDRDTACRLVDAAVNAAEGFGFAGVAEKAARLLEEAE
jgi:class 3 adenylate cyclase/tetratricopeptide (TPR) repeat protein